MLATVKRDILTDPAGVPLHGPNIDYVEKVICNDLQIPKTGNEGVCNINGATAQIGNASRIYKIGALHSEFEEMFFYKTGVATLSGLRGAIAPSSSDSGAYSLLLKKGSV